MNSKISVLVYTSQLQYSFKYLNLLLSNNKINHETNYLIF